MAVLSNATALEPVRTGEASTPLPRALRHILCLDDFETAAAAHLPLPLFGYVSGAAETNLSLRSNRQSFERYRFVPRALVDISQRSTTQTLFDQTYDAPFGIAPLGLSALTAHRGDVVLAVAAARAGIPMIMSGSSLIPLEEVASASPNAWFQAYLPGDDAGISALISRVARAGFGSLAITVDTPVAANRENNVRSGFSTPLRPSLRLAWEGISHPRWTIGTLLRTILQHGVPHFENNYATRGAPIMSSHVERDFSDRGHLNWRHFEMIRRMWRGRLIVKGILNADDAKKARDLGSDAIIVSNHGGRQLDGAVSPLCVLPDIVAACPDMPVMLDGGVRRGSDVLKAIALGARFVFVGRPFAYAAAVGGEAGVALAIQLLKTEVSRNMALLGVNRLSEVDREKHIMDVSR
jgi:L-lactate dehydrogenase (cytochrome)